jgi:hypothetical protein
MDKFKKILSTKLNRKKFFLFSAVSAFGIYSLLKMPFRILFKQKEKSLGGNNSIKISVNPDAISRNSGRQNG